MNSLKNFYKIITVFLLLGNQVFADSPLTSTPFSEAYLDEEIVQKAGQSKTLTNEIAEFLHSRANKIDLKAAVINAIGWNSNGNKKADEYCKLIFNDRADNIDPEDLSSDDMFVIGYIYAMDNYHNPEKSLTFLKPAKKKKSKSFTVSVIYSLVKSQIDMENDFCKVWKNTEKVFGNENLKQDMRESAKKIIFDYLMEYKAYCNK